jgi:hypothetical protein
MPIVIEEHQMENIIIDYDDIFHNIPIIENKLCQGKLIAFDIILLMHIANVP